MSIASQSSTPGATKSLTQHDAIVRLFEKLGSSLTDRLTSAWRGWAGGSGNRPAATQSCAAVAPASRGLASRAMTPNGSEPTKKNSTLLADQAKK
jgi:hypothetical protein